MLPTLASVIHCDAEGGVIDRLPWYYGLPSVHVNVAARTEIVLDTKYNEFRLFVVMYLDLIQKFETLSEYEVCATGFMSSSVSEWFWYVGQPNMRKRSKPCLTV